MKDRTISLANFAGIFNGYRGKSVAFLLLAELFLAQLAIASPHLHEWMHGAEGCAHSAKHHPDESKDTQTSEEHVCTIMLITEGLIQETSTQEVHCILKTTDLVSDPIHSAREPAIARHSARSPPLLQG